MDQTKSVQKTTLRPFEKRVYLATPTMHPESPAFVQEAFDTNWVSTVGANIDAVESEFAALLGKPYAVGLSSGTAALHMAVRACAERLYGHPEPEGGALRGKKAFCSDLTFSATVNPVVYEGGEPIFIDSEYETWNMDPAALERAFALYPEVRLVVLVHLYGTPAKLGEIRRICDAHGALLVEDAAESLSAAYEGRQTGSFGDVGVISFNGNKIITGSCGGLIVTDREEDMARIRKWSTQSREPAAWYQHKDLGYNYRMSNIIAGVIRGQLPYLEEHKARKRQVYERYAELLKDLPLDMNPWERDKAQPNHWLSCFLLRPEAMCPQHRSDVAASYTHIPGKSCPTEILELLASLNAEGRPIWKPMHMQPVYAHCAFVNADGRPETDVGADIFQRGLCLPSDIKMTSDEIERICQAVRACFN